MGTKTEKIGLTCTVDPGKVTPFISILRKSSLEITYIDNFEDIRSFCESLKAGLSCPKNLQNGVHGSSFLANGIIVVLGRNPIGINLDYMKYLTTIKKWIRVIGIGLWIL